MKDSYGIKKLYEGVGREYGVEKEFVL